MGETAGPLQKDERAVMVSRSGQSREQAREKALDLLEMTLAPGNNTGKRVGEAAAWLLAHAGILFEEMGEEANWGRLSTASHALIACRHKVVFGMAAEQDMSGIVFLCQQLAHLYAAVGEETEEKLLGPEWADPRPSWKALEMGVVGAVAAVGAALR